MNTGESSAEPACTEFLRDGVLLLRGQIPRQTIESLRSVFVERYRAYFEDRAHPDALKVGDRRFMVTVGFEPPFADPSVYAPEGVLRVLRALLTESSILGSVGVVLSLPGADDQPVHRDFPCLFPDMPALSSMLPPYAITMIIPLVDMDEVTGTTLVWPGSHRQTRPESTYEPTDAVWPRMSMGDVLMMDYRLVHGGSANLSGSPRPIMYLVYCRPWFMDHVNHSAQDGLRITPSTRDGVPPEHASLIARSGVSVGGGEASMTVLDGSDDASCMT